MPANGSLAVVDRPPIKLDPHWRMSSLDDEDEEQEKLVNGAGDGGGGSSPPHHQISPPYSPMGFDPPAAKDNAEIYGEKLSCLLL